MRITVHERLYGFAPKTKLCLAHIRPAGSLAGSYNRINVSLLDHRLTSYYIRPVWFYSKLLDDKELLQVARQISPDLSLNNTRQSPAALCTHRRWFRERNNNRRGLDTSSSLCKIQN